MTIDEAIENLGNLLKRYDFIDEQETHEATKLGIEALKRFKTWREIDTYPGFEILPGETKQQ